MNGGRYGPRTRLRREFFVRQVEVVAPELLGKALVHRDRAGLVALRIVEVEAYLGPGEDEASHAHCGRTPRNGNMFETPGRLYVYLSYGMHHCLNVVCEPAGQAAAILLRGAEVLAGEELLASRRGQTGIGVANGPGKLGQALAADLSWDGRSLLVGETGFWPGPPPDQIRRSARIGIRRGTQARLRFFDADSPCVSRVRAAL